MNEVQVFAMHAHDIKNNTSSSILRQSWCCERENVPVALHGEAPFLLKCSSMLKKLEQRKERAVTTTQTGKQMGKDGASTKSYRAGSCFFIDSYFQEKKIYFEIWIMEYSVFTIKEDWNPLSPLFSFIEASVAGVLDRKLFFQTSVFLERCLKRKACESQGYRSDMYTRIHG